MAFIDQSGREMPGILGRGTRKIRRWLDDATRNSLRRAVALSAPSQRASCHGRVSPHMLTCRQDLLMAMCTAKALNFVAEEAWPWRFHDDGSLSDGDVKLLTHHFPGCRVIRRSESDEQFRRAGSRWAAVRDARARHVMMLKLADVALYSDSAKVLVVDSDVLFFERPDYLLDRIDEATPGNYFNKDIATCYIAPVDVLEALTGIIAPEAVNAGLSLLHKEDLELDRLERLLTILDPAARDEWHFYGHLIEQTSVALLASSGRGGVTHFPPEYDVSLEKPIDGAVCKHYVGTIRRSYELEGLRHLLSSGYEKSWPELVRHVTCSEGGLER